MKKLLLAVFLLTALRVVAATGDISARVVNTDGWSVYLSTDGFTTGATYNFGYSGGVPTASTPYLTVVSKGFDNTGAATTITRTVYLTSNVQFPYASASIAGSYTSGTFQDGEVVKQTVSNATAYIVGGQSAGAKLYVKIVAGSPDSTAAHTWVGQTSAAIFAPSATPVALTLPLNDEKNNGTSLVTRFALSDYVYQKDNTGGGNSGTAPTITIPASFVTNSGGAGQTSNALSAAAVTQNSTQGYATPIARFVTLPYKLLNGAFTVECQAFERSAKNGLPVAAIVATLDDGTVTRNQTVTAMSLSSDADQLPVYAISDNASNFTQNANITCKIVVYPWVGDVTLDSSANAWQNTGMNLANLPVGVCDKGNSYVGANGATFCAVDNTNGNDSTGVASATQATAEATPCKTIAGAYVKIAAFNNSTYARNTVDGGKILIVGSGGNQLYGTGGSTFAHTAVACTITRSSATTRANAKISGFNGGGRYGSSIPRLYDMTVAASDNSNQLFAFVHDQSPLLIEDCTVTGAGGNNAMVSNDTNGKAALMLKNVTMTGYQGGISVGNDNLCLLARSGSFADVSTGHSAFINTRCVTGATYTDTDATGVDNFYKQGVPAGWTDNGNVIISYNKAFALKQVFATNITVSSSTMLNYAILANMAERTGASASSVMEFSGSPITNLLLWHNTVAGDRVNTEGDVTGGAGTGTNYTYQLCSFKFNSWYYNGTHNPGDVHVSNGLIIGQWPYSQFCVGWEGNNGEISPDQSLYSWLSTKSTVATSAGYTNDQSKHGGGAGNGNYTPASGSVLIGKILSGHSVLGYTLDRKAIQNDGTGAAGAYFYGTTQGVGFWWP